MMVLYKGKEGTDWKDIKLAAKGDLDSVIKDFPKRDGEYILWWLIDISKIPAEYTENDIPNLFMDIFSKDQHNLDYKVNFVVGFHDDVAKDRSWGILK